MEELKHPVDKKLKRPWSANHLVWVIDENEIRGLIEANAIKQVVLLKPYANPPNTTSLSPPNSFAEGLFLSAHRVWNFKISGVRKSNQILVYTTNLDNSEREMVYMKLEDLDDHLTEFREKGYVSRKPLFQKM